MLKKSFKYFDLNGNGVVEPDEFAKAIEKIGIQIPTRQVSSITIFLFGSMSDSSSLPEWFSLIHLLNRILCITKDTAPSVFRATFQIKHDGIFVLHKFFNIEYK